MRRSVPRWLVLLAIALILNGCSGPPTPVEASPGATRPAGDASPTAARAPFEATQTERVLANGSVVDDIRVGVAVECLATGPECQTRLRLARDAAIARHGLAPTAIGAAHFYLTYLPPGGAHGGGGHEIVVFDLADGSQAAVATVCFDGCFVVGPQAVAALTLESGGDHGPLVDPFVNAPVDCASAGHPTCNEAVWVAIAAATTRGFLTRDSIADAHYYVIVVPPNSAQAAANPAEYIVHLYLAGKHDVLAETGIGVACGSGRCQVVSFSDTTTPPQE